MHVAGNKNNDLENDDQLTTVGAYTPFLHGSPNARQIRFNDD